MTVYFTSDRPSYCVVCDVIMTLFECYLLFHHLITYNFEPVQLEVSSHSVARPEYTYPYPGEHLPGVERAG